MHLEPCRFAGYPRATLAHPDSHVDLLPLGARVAWLFHALKAGMVEHYERRARVLDKPPDDARKLNGLGVAVAAVVALREGVAVRVEYHEVTPALALKQRPRLPLVGKVQKLVRQPETVAARAQSLQPAAVDVRRILKRVNRHREPAARCFGAERVKYHALRRFGRTVHEHVRLPRQHGL